MPSPRETAAELEERIKDLSPIEKLKARQLYAFEQLEHEHAAAVARTRAQRKD